MSSMAATPKPEAPMARDSLLVEKLGTPVGVANDHDGWGLDIWHPGQAAPSLKVLSSRLPPLPPRLVKKGQQLIQDFEVVS